jgi:hypothetical protein
VNLTSERGTGWRRVVRKCLVKNFLRGNWLVKLDSTIHAPRKGSFPQLLSHPHISCGFPGHVNIKRFFLIVTATRNDPSLEENSLFFPNHGILFHIMSYPTCLFKQLRKQIASGQNIKHSCPTGWLMIPGRAER